MKKLSLIIFSLITLTGVIKAQTPGTLTFSYTPTSHNGYSGTKNVLAIWIQDNAGNFVKTRVRYVGGNTGDHLPTWTTNSGGTWTALNPACDITDATTGATLTSFSTKTITWDGTDVNGNSVSDGTYKVTVESCWDHGSSSKLIRSFSFTKGTSNDVQAPTNDANLTNISVEWVANSTPTNIEKIVKPIISIYPNPSTGLITINHNNAKNITIINLIGMSIYNQNIIQSGPFEIDLSNFPNGVYSVIATNGDQISKELIVLTK